MILITDDDPTTLTVARRVIAGIDARLPVSTATDGRQAALLVRAHAATLRLALLDVQLPLLDGVYVAADLRRRTTDVPIIPVTGTAAALPLLHRQLARVETRQRRLETLIADSSVERTKKLTPPSKQRAATESSEEHRLG